MNRILIFAFLFLFGLSQAQTKSRGNMKSKAEKEWVNPVKFKLTKEELKRPYMEDVLKTRDSLTPKEAERRRKNIAIGNPFAKQGFYPKIATLRRGKYLEFHDRDSIVAIGSVKYNRKQKKIISFIEEDLSNPDRQPLGDTHGRWISPDPLSEEFPDWTPYRYGFNNPIKFSDPTGMLEDIYEVDEQGNLTWKAESDRDVIYASKNFDKQGNLKAENDGGVDVGEKGYIANNSASETVNILDFGRPRTVTYDYIKFGSNTEKAQSVFDYLAMNTNVEYNKMFFSNYANDKFSFVGTIHEDSTVPVVKLGATMYENEHSHPDPITFWPSGFNMNYYNESGNFTYSKGLPTGDIKAAGNNPATKFILYAPHYKDGPLRIHFNGQQIISVKNENKK